uniref:Uncharacterized protein n=1 Tax=Strombidium sp. TaxID=181122 RepID=A0A7T0M4K1_9SPIT|nr:hypothetical protein [Strombidium sp.]
MAVVKSSKNHRRKLCWKFKYKTSFRKKLNYQKKIHLLTRNYSVEEKNLCITNFNLKIKFNSSYIFDVKTYYKNPKFLIMNYDLTNDYNLVITEPITLFSDLRKKITNKKAQQVILKLYNKQFKNIKKLYSTLAIDYFHSNNILTIEDVGTLDMYHLNKLSALWAEFLQTKIFLNYLETYTDYTLIFTKSDELLLVNNKPVFISKKIYSYMKSKYWAKKKLIPTDDELPKLLFGKLKVPKKTIRYTNKKKFKYYKNYNKTWRYMKFKRPYLRRIIKLLY